MSGRGDPCVVRSKLNKFEHIKEVRSGDPCMIGVSWDHYWGLGISLYGVGAGPGMGAPLQIDRHKRLKTLPSHKLRMRAVKYPWNWENLVPKIRHWSVPIDVVWSPLGPVWSRSVLLLCRVHGRYWGHLSQETLVQPHRSFSKSHLEGK